MVGQQKYSFLDRILHRMALGNPWIARASFDAEQSFMARQRGGLPDTSGPVFVAGLARAGTTLLMKLLYETGVFGSLTYRDMPFVLAPNIWSRLSHFFAKSSVSEERAHGDGVMIDFDSPEALEEAFWRVMCGREYIESTQLKPMTADDTVILSFRKYVDSVMFRYPGKRYLSKNNNNILRLSSLRQAFPNSIILVPFRNPIDQAASLMQQDIHFRAIHETDAFSELYMSWLAHHEFGAGHRPFVWGSKSSYKRDTIDYWLDQWIGVYQYLHLESKRPGLELRFVCYETLCNETEDLWRSLQLTLGTKMQLPDTITVNVLRKSRNTKTACNKFLEDNAFELYDKLKSSSLHYSG